MIGHTLLSTNLDPLQGKELMDRPKCNFKHPLLHIEINIRIFRNYCSVLFSSYWGWHYLVDWTWTRGGTTTHSMRQDLYKRLELRLYVVDPDAPTTEEPQSQVEEWEILKGDYFTGWVNLYLLSSIIYVSTYSLHSGRNSNVNSIFWLHFVLLVRTWGLYTHRFI